MADWTVPDVMPYPSMRGTNFYRQDFPLFKSCPQSCGLKPGLITPPPLGCHHDAVSFQLIQQRNGNFCRRTCQDDPIKWRAFRPPNRSIAKLLLSHW